MDSFPAQDVELHTCDHMLEVVLSGCAGVEASVPELQGTKQQALLSSQEAVIRADLEEGVQRLLRDQRAMPLAPLPVPNKPPLWPLRGGTATWNFHTSRETSMNFTQNI